MAFTLTTYAQLLDAYCLRASVEIHETTGAFVPTVQQKVTAARLLTDACDELWRFGNDHIILPCLMEVATVTPVSHVIARDDVHDTSKWSVWTTDPRASWSAKDNLWRSYLRHAVPDTDGLRVQGLTAGASVVVFYQREVPRFDWRDWATGTDYSAGDVRIQDGQCYKCLEGHASTDFNTDLTAGKWRLQQVPAEMTQAINAKVDELRAGNVTQRPAKQSVAIVTARSLLDDLYLGIANNCPPWLQLNGGNA